MSHVHYDHLLGLLAGGVFPRDVKPRFIAPFDNWLGQDTLKQFFSRPFWPYMPEFGEMVCAVPGEQVKLRKGVSALFHPANHPDGACILRLGGLGWSVCYACDYEHNGAFPDELARDCTLLLYDATYTDEEYPEHIGWGHSTWQEGCALAQRLGIPNLMLVHHAPEKGDAALQALSMEVRESMPGVRFARSGDVFDLTGHVPLWDKDCE